MSIPFLQPNTLISITCSLIYSLARSLVHYSKRIEYKKKTKKLCLPASPIMSQPFHPFHSHAHINTSNERPRAWLPKKCHSTPFTTNIKRNRRFFLNSFASVWQCAFYFFRHLFCPCVCRYGFAVRRFRSVLCVFVYVRMRFHFCLFCYIYTVAGGEGESNLRDGIQQTILNVYSFFLSLFVVVFLISIHFYISFSAVLFSFFHWFKCVFLQCRSIFIEISAL